MHCGMAAHTPESRVQEARLLASPFIRTAQNGRYIPTPPSVSQKTDRTVDPNKSKSGVPAVLGSDGEAGFEAGGDVELAAIPNPPSWARVAAPVLLATFILRACVAAPRVDCVLAPWPEKWTECSTSCGSGGTQTRVRVVATYAAHGGKPCPPGSRETMQERPCNVRPCPVDCALQGWGEWGECSSSCGGGVQWRKPSVRRRPAHGGEPCPGPARRACSTQPCPRAWQLWK